MEICMPLDQRQTPWKNTRARQDFGEELFLNVSRDAAKLNGSIFRLSLSTVAGYFELPNDMNGALPGPLRAQDPWHSCDSHCQAQGRKVSGDGFDISALCLGFLVPLILMAVYASFTPCWTHPLHAFTMMRLGAVIGEKKLPLLVGPTPPSLSALNTTPGWVGDEQENAEIGKLRLGAVSRLKRGRRYASCEGESDNGGGAPASSPEYRLRAFRRHLAQPITMDTGPVR